MLFLPMFVMNRLSYYLHTTQNNVTNENIGPITLAIITILVLTVVVIWGTACVITVGGRLLAATSGRSRTSFKAVRTETHAVILPLLLTNILRGIFTVLWGILLIIPGIIYALNTVLYAVIVVLEGKGYRAALKRSSVLMRGKRASVYITVILLSAIFFLPAYWLEALIEALVPFKDAAFEDFLSSAFYTISMTLYTLSLIQLYGSLLPKKKPVTGGKTMKAAAKKKVTKAKTTKKK